MTAYQKKKETEPNKKRAARPSRIGLGRLCAALFALLLLLSALPAAAETGVREPKFGDGLRASGGHNINAFIRWTLTHVDPSTVPEGAELALPAESCGTSPWQYLYGGIRTRTDETTLTNFYNNHYNEQMTRQQYDALTAHWSRSGYATDCQGLLDAWLTYEEGEPTDINVQMNYYYWCTQKGRIDEITRPYRIGEALFVQSETSGNMGHIGWVCGFDADGTPLAVESRGISYGVVITRIDHRNWTHRGLMTVVFSYPSAGSTAFPELPPVPDAPETPEDPAPANIISPSFGGGSGTEADPWLISTAAHLLALSSRVKAGHDCSGEYYRITNDITFNDTSDWEEWDLQHAPANEWEPIGYWNSASANRAFRGNLDGGGHTLRGLYFADDQQSFVGLFGYIREGADCAVRDLTIEESYFYGLNNVGGVAGMAAGDVIIENCRFTGRIRAELFVGGVVGYAEQRTGAPIILRCAFGGRIKAIWSAGGIVGASTEGTFIGRCFGAGAIEASDFIGGIAGRCEGTTVENCYNSGENIGNTAVAGLIGRADDCTLRCCYSACDPAPTETGGGFAAAGESSLIESCFYLQPASDALVNGFGEPVSAEELRSEEALSGFDFESVWTFDPLSAYVYPQLIDNPHFYCPLPQQGDVDGSGSVNVTDAVIALRAAMGVITLGEDQLPRADMNGSGTADVTDALMILRIAMGVVS